MLKMCDHIRYNELETKVNKMDNRLTAVETSVADMRNECKQGFTDLKVQLCAIYAERAEWGKWARQHLGSAFKWIGIIILAACGINQSSSIIETIARCFGANL